MRFTDIFKGLSSIDQAPLRKEKSVMGDLTSNFLSGGPTSAHQWLETYNENPRLSVVHKIAQDNGSAKFKIIGKTRSSEFIIKNHPLEKAINDHSVPQFFALWAAYRMMQGEVYIAYSLVNGSPTDLRVFSRSHKTAGGDGTDYQFRLGSDVLTYPASQVILDLDLDLVSPYTKGKGKAEAVKDEIETDELVQKYIKYFYYNSARPDIIITAEPGEELEEEDVRRVEQKWLNKFQGFANAHKPVFLSWAAKVISVPTNHRDMELLETRKHYRDVTIQHFSTPPEIMGIVENSNKATVIAAEHIYAKQVLMPLMRLQELLINTKLLPLYQGSENMRFEFDNIIPDDVELDIKVVEQGQKAAALTINEWRIKMGFPKIKSEYGNMIIGSAIPLEAVEIESQELGARAYKDYDKFLSEDFIDRASKALGKDLGPDTIVLLEEEPKSNAEMQ